MSAAIVGSDEREELQSLEEQKGREVKSVPSFWPVSPPPNSFINILAKSDSTNLLLRKWQWLPNAQIKTNF